VCLVPAATLSANVLTRPFDAEQAQLGLPASCTVFINSDSIAGIEEAGDLGFVMALETFTCFQVTADPTETLAAFHARVIRPWVLQGTAVWAGATVAAELFGGAGNAVSEPWAG